VTSAVTVSILITDLVGSTGLSTRVGPAVAETLRRQHFELLREAIEETGGREVKNLGDGLMVAFSSASGAVACAVAMHQRIERRNRSSAEQLAMRVGISMGDAAVEEDDYFGAPVVEASRLCDRAAGGQILASDLIARLADSAGECPFTALGAMELKGLPEPVETVEILWEPQAAAPLPARMQEMPPGAFVGRISERERLAELFQEARNRSRRLALISGEPGIGKTRLAARTALDERSEGAVVLYGRCDEELAVPYGLWVEALTHYIDHAPEKLLRAHVERHGGELVRLVPSLKERLPDISAPRETDPDTERYLLWGAVVGLLQEASQEEPLVLVLDDLQWGDKPSLLLLKHVISQGQKIQALLIGIYRDSDLTHGHPLAEVLADLYREEGVERLPLKGLDQRDVVEIMERTAGHELDEASVELSKQLFSETDGNPFYTGELLRHLLESGALRQQDGGRWTVSRSLSELGLPQSVREVVGRRIERLGPQMQKTLSIAAVIGREFDTDLLLRVMEYSEDTLLDLLEQAVAASVLVESPAVPGRFSFAHALISHTLYEQLGTTRRARLHRRVAEALEDMLGTDPEERISELAQHWAKATTAADLPKAVGYARRAGERALQELAPDEALRWFSQAVELEGQQSQIDPAEHCDLLIGLGEAQRQVGEASFRQTLLDACRLASEIGDADRAARAALANNRGLPSVFGDVDMERIAALERALELDDSADLANRAQLISRLAMEREFDFDHHRRRALVAEALQLARDAGDPRTLATVLADYFWTVWAPDTLERRRATVLELLGMLDDVGDPALEFWASLQDVCVSIESGDLDRAESASQRLLQLADELGQPTLRWFAAYLTGPGLALVHGDIAEAEQMAETALQIGTDAGQSDAFMVWGAQFAELCVQQDRGDEIVEIVEENVEANPGIPGWRAGLAHVYCWMGRTEEGGAVVEEAAKDRFDHVPWDQFRLSALTLYADAASQAGVRDAAAPLYELLEPWAEQIVWNGGTTYGQVRTYVGLLAATLGWDDLADEHLGLACRVLEEKRMLLWESRTHLGWAEALASRGETERAQAQAAKALALAREHGYRAIAGRAAAIVETGSAAKR
jgi:class 3 adenylate cyclase/tetratricopeptide (TPR) repeat protein